MRRCRYGDAGQAFPIYITVVGGLLLLAFAYLAVGQAAAKRNDAQTAADAAALAAAQDTRDQFVDLWVEKLHDPTAWQAILHGDVGTPTSCTRAYELAAQNDASVELCEPGPLSYEVEVKTNDSVGRSIVPHTEDQHAKASAKAVIEPLCAVQPPAEGAKDDVLPQLSCKDGRDWDIDLDDPAGLPEPQDLFDVHLAE
ncbi:hypothetical protein C3489_19880 [Streptomyces sp. Ru71]|uniref:pilus assembly protein TadG-related protein n=1 Tax=Streptomyces sp. Ru71 TaxID=2080746 RepID=UPI000CDD8A05|nr:pilus assembly protein TadG-related protein [Streptomyces sp. Ru71]POX51495.1 hypothetical protein C3489_19880 [Streptomyces sp. Ru71]